MTKLLLIIIMMSLFSCSHSIYKSKYTRQDIKAIDPSLIIDDFTLVTTYEDIKNSLMFNLINRGIVVVDSNKVNHINPFIENSSIRLIIESDGGYVMVSRQLVYLLLELKKYGVNITCHVGKAASMAFHTMVSVCDKVIAKKDVLLISHRSFYPVENGKKRTSATLQQDSEMSDLEATKLKLNKDAWFNITRGNEEDKVFTKKEMLKYKLVNEFE